MCRSPQEKPCVSVTSIVKPECCTAHPSPVKVKRPWVHPKGPFDQALLWLPRDYLAGTVLKFWACEEGIDAGARNPSLRPTSHTEQGRHNCKARPCNSQTALGPAQQSKKRRADSSHLEVSPVHWMRPAVRQACCRPTQALAHENPRSRSPNSLKGNSYGQKQHVAARTDQALTLDPKAIWPSRQHLNATEPAPRGFDIASAAVVR